MNSIDSRFEKRYFTKAQYAREKNLSPKSVQAKMDSGSLRVEKVGERELIVEEELCVRIPIILAGATVGSILQYNYRHPELQQAIN